MSAEAKDITRWNRAGLSRFEYVQGNAPLYLEQMRKFLYDNKEFHGKWQRIEPPEKIDKEDIPEGMIEFKTNETLLNKYNDERGDIGWELMRTFARACHVLTGHINAYINEAYLRTATQWEYIRRLVETIDYQPAPATSARTLIALEAAPGQKGTVLRGFQIQSPETVQQVVFETLEDVRISDTFNELRVKDYNKSQDPLIEEVRFDQPHEGQLPPIAHENANVLEGISGDFAGFLHDYASSSKDIDGNIFTIKDFRRAAEDDDFFEEHEEYNVKKLVKKKAILKAEAVLTPLNKGKWSDISNMTLTTVLQSSDAELLELSGCDTQSVQDLRAKVLFLRTCFKKTKFKRLTIERFLIQDPEAQSGDLKTQKSPWKAERKPPIAAGQAAIVINGNEGRTVFINSIDPVTKDIELAYYPYQADWMKWLKNEAILATSPMWQRKVWLNGNNVIQTDKPHGFNEKDIVAWEKVKGDWNFAEIIETDKFRLRLKVNGDGLPQVKTMLYGGLSIIVTRENPAILKEDETRATSFEGGEVPEMVRFTAARFNTLRDIQAAGGGIDIWRIIATSGNLAMIAVLKLLADGIEIPSTGEKVAKLIGDLINAVSKQGGDPSAEEIQKAMNQKPGDIKWETMDKFDKDFPEHFRSFPKNTKFPIKVFLVHIKAEPKGIVVEPLPQYICNGSPGKLQPGGWIVAELNNKKHQATTIKNIQEHNDYFSLTFNQPLVGELKKISGDFRGALYPGGYDNNNEDIANEIVLEDLPDELAEQQTVILDGPEVFKTSVVGIDKKTKTIMIDPAPDKELKFTKGNLILRGNIVTAGHGEAKPDLVLSTGSAPGPNQSVMLRIRNIATVSDNTMKRGIRADIEVIIDGRTWKQVSRLDNSGPTDTHYEVRISEDGCLKLIFGDGVHGRLLPAGDNNLRLRYRCGVGRAGNVPAGELKTLVYPHPLIKAVHQPFDAKGGEEQEGLEAIREHAPATTLALERAVSKADFHYLALTRPEIKRARAFLYTGGAGLLDCIVVVVVPVGGKELKDYDPLKKELQEYLQAHAVPTVVVRVESFKRKIAALSVAIYVNYEQYRPDDVVIRTRRALLDTFNPENRDINKDLFISEIYQAVEAVEGVEVSRCAFAGNEHNTQYVPADTREVVFLEDTPDTLNIWPERYVP